MKLSTHFIWIAIVAIFLAACTDSGPAATGPEIGTSQGGQSSFSMGGGSSSSGGTSGLTGCLMQMNVGGYAACVVGAPQASCQLDPSQEGSGMTYTYGACPTGWVATCEEESENGGPVITLYDYSPNGAICAAAEEPVEEF